MASKPHNPNKPALLQKRPEGLADKLKSYVRNSTSQVKSGLKNLRLKPKETLKAAAKAMPQGRAAKVALGLGAAAGITALATSDDAPAKKPAKYVNDGSDVPSVPASSKQAEKKPAKKSAPKKAATKGGNYPTYPKKSSQAASFRTAFAAARKAGKAEFTWEGRKYNTKLKGE